MRVEPAEIFPAVIVLGLAPLRLAWLLLVRRRCPCCRLAKGPCACGVHLAPVAHEIHAGTASSERVARAAERELTAAARGLGRRPLFRTRLRRRELEIVAQLQRAQPDRPLEQSVLRRLSATRAQLITPRAAAEHRNG